MRKLKERRVPVSAAESDGFLHVWQVTAHMLGILDEYIVPEAAWTVEEAIRRFVLLYLSEGRGIHLEIPDTNRPS
ncbi:hypothetical protein [Streptomyces sp. F63]|uniref:hypothetical protein n=1 Tax=Streptomyces sp. F63 TaxID=2824887 RepID=UPI001FFD4BCF|nr:hypothetical protein [Streptomyces sp. F63]